MSCPNEHWGLEFSQEEIAECKAQNGLLSLELELSRACNLRCIYCYAESGVALKDEMTLDDIFQTIDQAAGLGARKIIVLGGGEPLLYPHIADVIDHIKSHDLAIDLFTNGTLINAEVAQLLYDRNVAISIKMNSQDEAIQDELAGHKNSYQEISQGLQALLDVGYPDGDHTLGIETIICAQNYDEIPTLWRWARDRQIIPYIETMTDQGRASQHESLAVGPEKVRTMFEQLAQIDRDEYGNTWLPRPPLAGSHCARHEYSCTVTSIGEVFPCPGVSIATGNIKTEPLADILAGSTVIQELRQIRTNIHGKCKGCEHLDFCYGCRGNAYQCTGDHLASDPACWIKENI